MRPISPWQNVASGPRARRREHRNAAYGLVREYRSAAATTPSGRAAVLPRSARRVGVALLSCAPKRARMFPTTFVESERPRDLGAPRGTLRAIDTIKRLLSVHRSKLHQAFSEIDHERALLAGETSVDFGGARMCLPPVLRGLLCRFGTRTPRNQRNNSLQRNLLNQMHITLLLRNQHGKSQHIGGEFPPLVEIHCPPGNTISRGRCGSAHAEKVD